MIDVGEARASARRIIANGPLTSDLRARNLLLVPADVLIVLSGDPPPPKALPRWVSRTRRVLDFVGTAGFSALREPRPR